MPNFPSALNYAFKVILKCSVFYSEKKKKKKRVIIAMLLKDFSKKSTDEESGLDGFEELLE